jgi:uncharacterized protein YbjT (DUF2867 family)
MQQHKTAIIIGATGLTGKHLLHQLLNHPAYDKVTALVRRPMGITHDKLHEVIFDFDHPDASVVKGDDLYCAMGTTLAKAGSKPAQYLIDCTYPAETGRIAKANGVRQYLLVSSIGASSGSSNFYLKTKGELEDKIAALGFDLFASARPSFLLGNREEFRLGEKIGIVLAKLLAPLFLGGIKKYRGINSADVAAALITKANSGDKGTAFMEYDELMHYAHQ